MSVINNKERADVSKPLTCSASICIFISRYDIWYFYQLMWIKSDPVSKWHCDKQNRRPLKRPPQCLWYESIFRDIESESYSNAHAGFWLWRLDRTEVFSAPSDIYQTQFVSITVRAHCIPLYHKVIWIFHLHRDGIQSWSMSFHNC